MKVDLTDTSKLHQAALASYHQENEGRDADEIAGEITAFFGPADGPDLTACLLQLAEAGISGDNGTSPEGSAVTLEEENPNCAVGLHSWIDAIGKLPANTKCDHCDETYGHPD